MSETRLTKILLVDDDEELTGMLRDYLCAEGFEVTAAGKGQETFPASISSNPDAIILDIMLPDISGIDVLRQLRQTNDVPVIMLTAKGDEADRVLGLELGADDYLPKPFSPRELVARIRAVLRRRGGAAARRSSADRFDLGNLSIDMRRRQATCDGRELDLTVSELSMLQALASAPEIVVTKDELSEKVLGRRRQPYDRSIDVHVSNLRQKLAAARARVSIQTVRAVGYRMVAGI